MRFTRIKPNINWMVARPKRKSKLSRRLCRLNQQNSPIRRHSLKHIANSREREERSFFG